MAHYLGFKTVLNPKAIFLSLKGIGATFQMVVDPIKAIPKFSAVVEYNI